MTFLVYYRGKIPEEIMKWISNDGYSTFTKEGVRGHECMFKIVIRGVGSDSSVAKERVESLKGLLNTLAAIDVTSGVLSWEIKG